MLKIRYFDALPKALSSAVVMVTLLLPTLHSATSTVYAQADATKNEAARPDKSKESKPNSKKVTVKNPNFHEHVAPIIYKNCSGCHQPGEGAPFNLLNFKDVAKRSQMIDLVVSQSYMPPWHPKRGPELYRNSRKLSKSDRKTIARWVKNGSPEGPKAMAKKVKLNTSGWTLGKPDLIVKMDAGYKVPASGADIYRSFIAKINSKKRLYVRAIDVRSSSPEVLHHVLYFSSPAKQVRALDKKSKAPGFRSMGYRRLTNLGGWAVGGQPSFLPDGLAREIPAGADMVLDAHFHLSGREQECVITLGLYLSEKPPVRRLNELQLPTLFGRFANIDIPAGDASWKVKRSTKISHDIDLISVAGHAHYLGKKMKSWAILPDGKKTLLFHIDNWDFNWQERYTYAKPIRIPAGSTIHVELTYDNSSSNPSNPHDPPRRVKWGQESTDEMGSVIFNFVMVNDYLRSELFDSLRKQFLESKDGSRLKMLMTGLKMMDANQDGLVTKAEIPKQYHNVLQRLDRNGDGALDMIEIETLGRRSKNKAEKKKQPKSDKPKIKKPKKKKPKREFF